MQPTVLDDEHASGCIALADHELIGLKLARAKLTDQRCKHRRRESRKDRMHSQQVAKVVMAHLKLELGPDLRVVAHQRGEHRSVKSQGPHFAARAHRRAPRPLFQQGQLAESITRTKLVQRDLLATLAVRDDPRRAGHQHAESVGGVPLSYDHRAKRIRNRNEAVLHQLARIPGHS